MLVLVNGAKVFSESGSKGRRSIDLDLREREREIFYLANTRELGHEKKDTVIGFIKREASR